MAYTLDIKDSIKIAPKDLKSPIKAIVKDLPEKDRWFAQDDWNKTKTRQWQIKISPDNYSHLAKIFSENTTGKNFTSTLSGYKIKFEKSGKKSNGSSSLSDAQTTRKQELGSAWIFRRALKDNKRYSNWQDILKDPKYNELEAIYPEITDDWLKGYFAQQKKMLSEFSNPKFTEFTRDGGFMNFISDLVKTKFGIQQKDTWNPADIWLIQNENNVIKTIEDELNGGKSQTIKELNAILREMYRKKIIVGVSLKKISGSVARYEEYNIKDIKLDDDGTYDYDVTDIRLDLTLKQNNPSEFNTQDFRIIVDGRSGVSYNFQIKGNDSSKFSNLKFEPTQKGATAARVGKAPLAMVNELIKDNNLSFVNDNSKYPRNLQEFIKKEKQYKTMYNAIKDKCKTFISDRSAETFISNMTAVFAAKEKAHIANSKCMQIHLCYELLKLSQEDLNEFMTDMVFLSAKKGNNFGPFGKLY